MTLNVNGARDRDKLAFDTARTKHIDVLFYKKSTALRHWQELTESGQIKSRAVEIYSSLFFSEYKENEVLMEGFCGELPLWRPTHS